MRAPNVSRSIDGQCFAGIVFQPCTVGADNPVIRATTVDPPKSLIEIMPNNTAYLSLIQGTPNIYLIRIA